MIARIALLVLAALLASACDVLDDTFNEVQKEHGVDLRNPVDAATAVSGAEATGNKDAADGLKAMKGFRRAEHESKGDERYYDRDYSGAIAEYREALRWSQGSATGDVISGLGGLLGMGSAPKPDPEYERQLAGKRAALHTRIGNSRYWLATHAEEAGRNADARREWRAAAEAYELAAAQIPAGGSSVSTPLTAPADKADLLRWAQEARARSR